MVRSARNTPPTPNVSAMVCLKPYFFGISKDVYKRQALRSEQALSSQSVLSAENLVSHVTHASDTLNSSYVIRDTFDISNAQAQSLIPSRNKINNLLRLTDTLTDHSLIESVTFYYDDHTYHKLEQFNTDTQKLFLPCLLYTSRCV